MGVILVQGVVREDQGYMMGVAPAQRRVPQQERMMAVDDIGREIGELRGNEMR